MCHQDIKLLNDKRIAELFGVSESWVRVQRYNRRHGLSHELNIDPVMIGSMPRYRHEDVIAWIDSLSPANDNRQDNKHGELK
ncbi:MAG: hypothetical protein HOM65_09170 [Verrucomicrobia bacterium]|nr:hypothetical protein [Verrucomicrobiota bacterium]